MSEDRPFADLMARLRAGDQQAAEEVFRRFADRLIALAAQRLGAALRRKVDPEDVLQSAFRTFFRRQAAGLLECESWESLWGLLAVITLRKCGHQVEHFRAARRDVRREALPLGPAEDSAVGWQAIARDPTPLEAAALVETVELLLRELDERDRHILELSLQGETVERISAAVGCSERTVERVLERVRQRLERIRDHGAERS